jgi:hypothetical protein
MWYYTHSKCRELYRLCYNCTKLSIDVYDETTYIMLKGATESTHRWVSIPFPSNYHYSSCVQYPPPWIRQSLRIDQLFEDRPYAIAFMASTKVTAAKQVALRKLLRRLCESTNSQLSMPLSATAMTSQSNVVGIEAKRSLDRCLLINLGTHDSMTGTFQSARNANISPYSLARLCLMPGGDFPTRKATLDALLAGCVPVTFELSAAQLQWPWHWQGPQLQGQGQSLEQRQEPRIESLGNQGTNQRPKQSFQGHEYEYEYKQHQQQQQRAVTQEEGISWAMNCTIYIPRDEMMKRPDETFQRLIRLSRDKDFMKAKLQAISEVGHRMQYNLPYGIKKTSSDVRTHTRTDAQASNTGTHSSGGAHDTDAQSSPSKKSYNTIQQAGDYSVRTTHQSTPDDSVADNKRVFVSAKGYVSAAPMDAVDVILEKLLFG